MVATVAIIGVTVLFLYPAFAACLLSLMYESPNRGRRSP